jgi:hypothetical protein
VYPHRQECPEGSPPDLRLMPRRMQIDDGAARTKVATNTTSDPRTSVLVLR